MTKSQFNIKISKDLLVKVKRQATMSGKSLTKHITDLVTESLSKWEIDIHDDNSFYSDKINELEKRLMNIESIVSNREYISISYKPFSDKEAINCTKFMRSIFDQEAKKRDFENKKEAFDDFLNHIKIYDQLTNLSIDRLKEIMLSDKPNPWTGEELNQISGGDKCKCSIRKGLIHWIGIKNCPSQQEICDKGEELVPLS